MQTTARSLILDLLSSLRRGTMPVRALVEAGTLLGIEENNIRVSLARLYASGRIERDERGHYRLGPALEAISGQLRNWRDLATRTRPWSGDWIAVHQPRLGRGPTRRRRERALEWLGFSETAPGFSLRPDNLRGGVAELRRQLVRLASARALPLHSPSHPSTALPPATADPAVGRVFLARDFDPICDLEARSLWDADSLAREARDSADRIRESAAQLDRLSSEDAMVETFLVGGRVLRQLVQHPLLPAEILDPRPLTALLEEMKRYDEFGRACWAPFLARHQVPHRALPLDSRQTAEDLRVTTKGRSIDV